MSDIFKGVGIEVSLKTGDDFLKVRETLTRIGVPSPKDKKLYQSCHILHKKGRYVILHFKELFKLEHKPCSMNETDFQRRNTIVTLLEDWGLLEIVDKDKLKEFVPFYDIKIIPFAEKNEWELITKHSIGKRSKTNHE